MPWVLALLLLTQDPVQPDKLEVRTERAFQVTDVPFSVTIHALDKDGNELTNFAGPVRIKGLIQQVKDEWKPVESSALFEDGKVTLSKLLMSGDKVTITYGSLTEEWTPRVVWGWWTILPPILAIALAIITRQVLIALLAGIWIGVAFVIGNPFAAVLRTFDEYILASVSDSWNASIMIFTLALGGMVGLLSRSGSTKALVDQISKKVKTRRSGMAISWLMGLVIFFDDYANCLLVGNTVRPMTDDRKISREKLSFIVDSTAAPVATVAVVSTWIGYQIGQIKAAGVVPAGEEYVIFIEMLPYAFYSWFCLVFVLMISLSGRDFGPMYAAEHRALSTGQVLREGAEPLMDRDLTDLKVPEGKKLYWWIAVVPIVAVIFIVIGGLYWNGLSELGDKAKDAGLRDIIGAADSSRVLIWASFGGSLLALILILATGTLKLKESMEAWVAGAKAMMTAIFILVLAWTLGAVCKEQLMTGPWIMTKVAPPAALMPIIIFIVSGLIAFATGTSFGTMAIVIPIAGPMVWALTGDEDSAIRLATLASVLTGAVFGDHCSPISDTTIMSSMAAGSDHVDHVRTQSPYALVCAGVSALLGFVLVGFGVPWYVSYLLGIAALAGVLWFVGKDPEQKAAA